MSGEGELLLYSADERTAHLFALNGHGTPLARTTFHDGRVRAIGATQSGSPGFFVVAEESSACLLRSHDLALCARLHDAGGVVSCACVHEPRPGSGRVEVLLGLESGALAVWLLDVAHLAV